MRVTRSVFATAGVARAAARREASEAARVFSPPSTIAPCGASKTPPAVIIKPRTSPDPSRALLVTSALGDSSVIEQALARARAHTGTDAEDLFARIMLHPALASVSTEQRDALLASLWPTSGGVPVLDFTFATKLMETLIAAEDLDETVRTRVYALLSQGVDQVVASTDFIALSPSEQCTFLDLWQVHADTAYTRMLLLRLLHARTASGAPVLTDVALRPHHSELGSPPSLLTLLAELDHDLLIDTLTAVIRPEVIVQSTFETCGFTSVEYTLVRNHPGEYVRLVAVLARYGSVAMRGGDSLSTGSGDAWGIRRREDDARLMSSRLFQSAAMQSTTLGGYDLERDGWGPLAALSGVFPWEVAALLTQLSGRRHVVSVLPPSTEVLDRSGHGAPSFVMMNLALGLHFLNVVGTSGEGEDVRVILRNPWGGASTERLTEQFGFAVRTEPGPSGYLSMSLADFRAHMSAFIR